ncbi:hypothetical protein STAQ_26800 [Allostella sp. ATCC 35155]|nr:hypothetical protein STAQ_26800 [Stella sp. ATCC 35155]
MGGEAQPLHQVAGAATLLVRREMDREPVTPRAGDALKEAEIEPRILREPVCGELLDPELRGDPCEDKSEPILERGAPGEHVVPMHREELALQDRDSRARS